MIYIRLFLSFLVIGALTFGGGYSSLPLVLDACTRNGWLTAAEFSDLISLAELTPGPIAINAAAFAGTRAGGLPGAAAATLGFILAPFAIVSALWYIYKKYRKRGLTRGVMSGLRPCVVALIAAAGLKIFLLALGFNGETNADGGIFTNTVLPAFTAAAAFIILRVRFFGKKPPPVVIILGGGVIGLAAEILRAVFQ